MSGKALIIVLGIVILVLLGVLLFVQPAQTPTQEEAPAATEPAY